MLPHDLSVAFYRLSRCQNGSSREEIEGCLPRHAMSGGLFAADRGLSGRRFLSSYWRRHFGLPDCLLLRVELRREAVDLSLKLRQLVLAWRALLLLTRLHCLRQVQLLLCPLLVSLLLVLNHVSVEVRAGPCHLFWVLCDGDHCLVVP